MSKSYRKTPIMGLASDSDKWYKIYLHKKHRRKVNIMLQHGIYDGLSHNIPYDSYSSPKDGKTDFFGLKKKDLKFYKKLMRK